MNSASQPIVVEQAFNVSRDVLWQAITQRDQMAQWFFSEIPDFEPRVGFQTQFNVHAGERDFLHLWKIVEAVPGKKIVYDWRYRDFPGAGKVTFEVLDDPAGSRLRVTNEGLESFPRDVPEFSRERCDGGWKYLVQGNLRRFLSSAGK